MEVLTILLHLKWNMIFSKLRKAMTTPQENTPICSDSLPYPALYSFPLDLTPSQFALRYIYSWFLSVHVSYCSSIAGLTLPQSYHVETWPDWLLCLPEGEMGTGPEKGKICLFFLRSCHDLKMGAGKLSSNKGEADHLHRSGTFKGKPWFQGSNSCSLYSHPNSGSIPFLSEPCLWCRRLARAENSTFYEYYIGFVFRSWGLPWICDWFFLQSISDGQ